MGLVYRCLFWFVVLTTISSGGIGFLMKTKDFYRPDVYLINKCIGGKV